MKVRTEVLHISAQPENATINKVSAAVWNAVLELYPQCPHTSLKRISSWLQEKLKGRFALHSQTVQAIVQRYIEGWRSFYAHRRNGNKKAHPPNKPKQSYTTRWKKSAVSFDEDEGMLKLSNGVRCLPLVIQLPDSFDYSKVDRCQTVDLCERFGAWELHFTYRQTIAVEPAGDGVLGIDLGEIHPMVAFDGTRTAIYNGRHIRSLCRLRNKKLKAFGALIAAVPKFSPEYRRLVQRKWKWLNRIDRQIKDCLHQHTAAVRKYCLGVGIGTVVIGDLTNIRKAIQYGRKANQKLHQWSFARVAELLVYKLEAVGVVVESVDEAYTSQTCPCCGDRHKPKTRNYHCKGCGFRYHRDAVGAINIRRKYLGGFSPPVAAAMAPPRGIRLNAPVARS